MHDRVGNSIAFSRASVITARVKYAHGSAWPQRMHSAFGRGLGLPGASAPSEQPATRRRDNRIPASLRTGTQAQFPLVPARNWGPQPNGQSTSGCSAPGRKPPLDATGFALPIFAQSCSQRSHRNGGGLTSDERAQGDAGWDRLAAVVGVVLREVRVPCVVVKHESAGMGAGVQSGARRGYAGCGETYARFAL